MPASSDRTEVSVPRTLAWSTAALLAALGCIALFLPPLAERTAASPLRTALSALALAGAVLWHWWTLGRLAQRLGQSVPGWVGLSVALFPVGSAAALMLLGWAVRGASPQGPHGPHGPHWRGDDAALPHHG